MSDTVNPPQHTPAAAKRMVLTSVNQVLVLVSRNPSLAEQMPRFAGLVNTPLSTAPKKSCNCGGKQNITTPDVNKQVTENLLSSLTKEDFLQMKSILGLDELCYYSRNTAQNKLELICV
jgi:hypothetical protein